jgi:hypothetical protein
MKRMMTVLVLAAVLGTAAIAQEAVIREMSGTVEIKAPGSNAWVPAAPGQRLERETLISTGFKSTALLALGNSTLTVRPLTRLSLEELSESQGAERTAVFLRTGRVRAEVTPPAGRRTEFSVRSPSATASVRGTAFDFDGVNLRVSSGTVSFSGSGSNSSLSARAETKPVLVSAGSDSYVDESSGTAVSVFSAAETGLAPVLPAGSESGVGTAVTSTTPIIPLSDGSIAGRIEWETQ